MRAPHLFSLLALAACAPQITVTNLNPPRTALPQKAPADVQVYVTDPPKNVRDLYQLEAGPDIPGDPIDALRAKAAWLGCDGLVIVSRHDQTPMDPRSVVGVCVQLLAPAEAAGSSTVPAPAPVATGASM
ncbi:MAG: hypothetical protein R3B06_14070 [Kofleriaceae bacterium]